ncbi:MAG: hypothetical protein FK733_00885 [Asgard group archaeon]|nr:hypothetical protein [Asgard group archaeon]
MSQEKNEEVKPTRRSKYEIWSEILEVCLYTPRTQTWILRKLGLKTSSVKEAIQYLIERGLLEVNNGNEESYLYKTSRKGEEALILFYQLITKYFDSKSRKKILHWSIYEDESQNKK